MNRNFVVQMMVFWKSKVISPMPRCVLADCFFLGSWANDGIA